jgi:hypothetical protein
VSDEAAVKARRHQSCVQGTAIPRPSSVHCVESPSPPLPDGSEERKRPTGGMRNVSQNSLSSTCAMVLAYSKPCLALKGSSRLLLDVLQRSPLADEVLITLCHSLSSSDYIGATSVVSLPLVSPRAEQSQARVIV